MDQYDHKYVPMQKPTETSSGPYVSPPPMIGHPTRDKVVGDPPKDPAAEVKTKKSKSKCCEGVCHALHCILACCHCLLLCGAAFGGGG